MVEERFNYLECPKGIEGCEGLAVTMDGSGIKLRQGEVSYLVKNFEGYMTFGNCPNYLTCHNKLFTQTRRRSGII